MTHDFEIDPDRNLVVRRWTGDVTLEALVRGLAELDQHPNFDPRFDVIEDYSLASLVVSRACLEQFRQKWKSLGWNEVGRWVTVMPQDLEYGIGRQVKALWDLDNAMVFRTQEEALAWLGHSGGDSNASFQAIVRPA